MTHLFQLVFIRTDKDTLPSGACIGFSTTVDATDIAHARYIAAERLATLKDGNLLFIEKIEDVTP